MVKNDYIYTIINQNNKKMEIVQYLGISFVGVIIICLGWSIAEIVNNFIKNK